MNEYPVGLLARTDYFRVLKSVWTQEAKDFVIERMKTSPKNIKPVIVLDDVTKKSECYMINSNLDTFVLNNDLIAQQYCLRVESISEWFIGKAKIQKSNKSQAQKEIDIKALEKAQGILR